MNLSRRTVLGALGAGAATAALGATGEAAFGEAAVGAPGPDVSLVDNGSTVTLTNGLVSATLVKATGRTTAVQLVGSRYGNAGVNLLSGTNGGGYSTFN